MDFEKLYEPYKTKVAPLASGQISWLAREGFSQDVIDRAMLQVYGDMAAGKKFESDGKHSPTYMLWEHLRNVAREMQRSDDAKRLKHLEEFHSSLVDRADVEWNSLSKFQKIIAVLRGKA